MKLLKYIRDYKSNTGIILAGIYLLVLIWVSVEFLTIDPPSKPSIPWDLFYLFILTLPVSSVFLTLFGLFVPINREIGFLVLFFSGVVNALGPYFSGYLLTRIFVSLKDALLDFFRR